MFSAAVKSVSGSLRNGLFMSYTCPQDKLDCDKDRMVRL
jgi:hypothetical protein